MSDFSLIPVIKENKEGWEYRVATWSLGIDPYVHQLFDKERIDPIHYQRAKIRNGQVQHCTIMIENDRIVMKPGDGFDYYVRRDSENNKLDNDDDHGNGNDSDDKTDNENIPHDLVCDICLTNKKTHVVIPCFHLVACSKCAIELSKRDECPICKCKMKEPMRKIFF